MTLEQPNLVLLHGFAQTAGSWNETIAQLRGVAHTVPIELPGHGDTGLRRGEPSPALVRDMILDSVRGDFVVWGYSQGGRGAFDVALEAPARVRALIVESGIPGIEDPVARADRRSRDYALSTRLEAGSIEDFVAMWEKIPALGKQSAEVIEKQRPDRLAQDPEALAAALRGIGQGSYEPMWHRLGQIRIPVLLISGERDVVYTRHAQRATQMISGAEHVVIPDAGHAVHMERPIETAAAVRRFLARLS